MRGSITRCPSGRWRDGRHRSRASCFQGPCGWGPIRQITVTDLGHEEPTIVLTNQLRRTTVHLVGRYAQRMLIENGIADSIDFFHMDALSSAVAM